MQCLTIFCCDGPAPVGRACVGIIIPLIAALVLTVFAILALRGKSLAGHPFTPSLLGWCSIGVGAGTYLLYLSQKHTQIGPHHGLGWPGLVVVGIMATPLIVLGALSLSGYLSVFHTALGVTIVGVLLLAPAGIVGLCGCCVLCREISLRI